MLGGDARVRAARCGVRLHAARAHADPAIAAPRARARRLPREAARPHARRRRGDRRGLAAERAPSARSATSGAAWTCWRRCARRSATTPPGMLVSRSFGADRGRPQRPRRRRTALVPGSPPQRRHPVRAREPRHRPAVRARRAGRVGAGDGGQRPAGARRRAGGRRSTTRSGAELRFADGGLGGVLRRLDGARRIRRSTRSTCSRPRSRSSCELEPVFARARPRRRPRRRRAGRGRPARVDGRPLPRGRAQRATAAGAVLAGRRARHPRDRSPASAIATGERVPSTQASRA